MNDPQEREERTTTKEATMSVDYRTTAYHATATPLGLIPARWKVMHWCTLCGQRVEPDQLIAHARQHESEVIAEP